MPACLHLACVPTCARHRLFKLSLETLPVTVHDTALELGSWRQTPGTVYRWSLCSVSWASFVSAKALHPKPQIFPAVWCTVPSGFHVVFWLSVFLMLVLWPLKFPVHGVFLLIC